MTERSYISTLRTAAAVMVLALAVLGPAASVLGAAAKSPYRPVRVPGPDPAPSGRWAERTAVAGDLDGDGVNDLFVGQPAADIGGQKNIGRVYALSGRALAGGRAQVLYAIDAPEPQVNAAFGFVISVLGDVNGDTKPDLAVGTDAQDVGAHVDQGRAWVFSGADGALLYALDNPAPQGSAGSEGTTPGHQAHFGSRIGRAGDVNADGVADLVVGASGNDIPAGCSEATPFPAGCRAGQGQAFIFDGRSGGLLRTLDLPVEDQSPPGECQSGCGSFGLSVQSPGDTDGDGVADQLVGAPRYNGIGRMYVFSGRTGEVLLRIDDPAPHQGATFGFQDAAPLAPGDVNGDGRADIYGNGFLQNVRPTGNGEGEAWVFDGTTGAVLYSLRAPVLQDGAQFGFSVDRTDFDGDGLPDLYVGSSPHHVAGAIGSGGTYVFNARNGALLQTLDLPAADVQPSTNKDLGPNLGWTVSAPGDLNGDRKPDYVAGAPFADRGANLDEGLMYVFLSGHTPAGGERTSASGRSSGPGNGTALLAIVAITLLGAGAFALSRRSRSRTSTSQSGGPSS